MCGVLLEGPTLFDPACSMSVQKLMWATLFLHPHYLRLLRVPISLSRQVAFPIAVGCGLYLSAK